MKRVIDAIGAPPRSVARCAVRSLVSRLFSRAEVSASTGLIVVFSRLPNAIRAHGRAALYARPAPQPLHRRQFRGVDDRHRGRRVGADRGLSVMNGFQKEVRTRILGVVSHLQIIADDNRLEDWQSLAKLAAQHPRVVATAPFVQAQAMLSNGQSMRGAVVRGILPEEEEKVADLARHMRAGSLGALRAGEFGVVLGADLARALGVLRGEKIALIAPQGIVTPAGVIPRLKQFTVAGVFEAGLADADAGLALVHLQDAQTLYQLGAAGSGVRLKLADLFAARTVAHELLSKLPPDVFASAWTRSHANFFRAVEIEKRMMFLILGLIVLVAAINIISTLVMAVTDKQADIAILRTLGAAPRS